MTWEDILKQNDVTTELKELEEYAEDMSSEVAPSSGIADELNYKTAQLKDKIDDKLFRDLQKQIRNISNKSDDLGVAFGVFADIIDDYLEEREPRPPSSSYKPNPELRALDRSPPASYYED